VKLFIVPDDTANPLIEAMRGARKSIEIAIFRMDRKDLERELAEAAKRGVAVHVLLASRNGGGEKSLHALEARLAAAGAVVSRTAEDLTRYHGKFMIVDRERLYILAFNFTRSDLERARSFGVAVTHPKLVQEAVKLFLADAAHQPYAAGSGGLVVSPSNAREQLREFLKGAGRELLIYDPEISDKTMLQILKKRADDGVKIRVIGEIKSGSGGMEVRASHPLRLHARTIIRDREIAFLGSQSLRRLELDSRREVGIIFPNRAAVERLVQVFEEDWKSAQEAEVPAEKVAKKVAKEVAKDLAPVAPLLEEVAAKNGAKLEVDGRGLEETVKEAVKTAVRDAVHEAVTQEPAPKE
jgi:phosphatidylserine/phosphatidylglycerophosphate/cardiolipin synthase-like enzyme